MSCENNMTVILADGDFPSSFRTLEILKNAFCQISALMLPPVYCLTGCDVSGVCGVCVASLSPSLSTGYKLFCAVS